MSAAAREPSSEPWKGLEPTSLMCADGFSMKAVSRTTLHVCIYIYIHMYICIYIYVIPIPYSDQYWGAKVEITE